MPIEIIVFPTHKAVPAGKYEARRMFANASSIFITEDSPLPAQIISGAHAGKIIPYEGYIKVGDMPADGILQSHNIKMLGDLADAGRTISEHVKTIGAMRKEMNSLIDSRILLGSRIDELEAYTKELHEERAMLLQQIESEVDKQKVDQPAEDQEAENSGLSRLQRLICIGVALEDMFFAIPNLYQQREENKRPF